MLPAPARAAVKAEPTVPATSHLDSAASAPAAAVAPIMPDAALTKTIAQVRLGPIGAEPTAVTYLDLINAGRASAPQVNDFAAYLAKRGMPRVALAFQEYAVKLDDKNPILWMNLGTIRRTNGSLGSAAAALKSAIALDPAIAMAHYNLGAIYDADKKYDDAVEEFRRALVLDPDLADPRKNPQIVNNERLLAVKLQIYSDQAGSLGLPLLQMQKNEPPPKPSPDKNKK
jgi:tetratricopeptide (TPR) repeat protein